MSCTLVFLCEVCRVEQWRARIIELLTMWYLHFLYTYRHFCMTDIFCSRVSDSFWSVVSFVCFHACSGCTNRAGLCWSNWFALLIPNQQIAYAINGAGLCSCLAFCTRLLAHWPAGGTYSELANCLPVWCVNALQVRRIGVPISSAGNFEKRWNSDDYVENRHRYESRSNHCAELKTCPCCEKT